MRIRPSPGVAATLLLLLLNLPAAAQRLPKENVVEVPAVGEGLCLHNLFQSNMVLQRDKPIRIWGYASPGEKVSVSFADQVQSATAAEDRSWSVTFPPMPADAKSHQLVVQGKQSTVTLDSILLGDVWLLGGQSNMEFPLSRVENGSLEIASANFPNIRILTVPVAVGPEPVDGFARLHEWSSWSSRHFRKGDWEICSPETVNELSAIGYVFARRIHTASQVPIGVIDVSRGGTTVEAWTPSNVLREIKTEPVQSLLAKWDADVDVWDAEQDLKDRIARHRDWVKRMQEQGNEIPKDRTEPTDLRPGPAKNQNRPGNCFAGMISPIAGLSVKGAIFHQGYNNCFNGTEGAKMYRAVFPAMITAWRSAFNDQDLPFGILSLCTEGTLQTRDNFTSLMSNPGPYIREAQYQTFLELFEAGDKNVGFVSTYDLRRRWYHPQLKIPAGERIARWALATQYDMSGQLKWQPPMLTEMKLDGESIVLKFDTAVNGVDNGGAIEGFAIAGEDRKFHPAEAVHLVVGQDDRGRPRRDNSSLVLTSPMVPNPVHYRYAWARNPMGNLQVQGNTDIPLATQRSDDWPLENIPLGVLGDEPPTQVDRGQRRQIQIALEQEDLRRRLAEAKALIREHQEAAE